MQNPLLTICICTHNRSADFCDCLEALCSQDLTGLQIIVVDSASDEDERRMIAAAVSGKAQVQLIRLDTPGTAKARNAGLSANTSPWLAFIDDDAIVAPDWVTQAKRLISAMAPDVFVIAGRVDPAYPAGHSPRCGPRWNQLLSLIQEEGEVLGAGKVVTCNAIFRADAIKTIGAFPEQLGRVGNILLSGEEKFVVEKLQTAGMKTFYSDKLCVCHRISPTRLTRNWAATRAYWDGVTDQKIHRFMRLPVNVLTIVKIAVSIPLLALLAPSRSQKHEFFIRLWYNIGVIRETLSPIRVNSLSGQLQQKPK